MLKSKKSLVCGLYNGTVEIRRVSDLELLSSFLLEHHACYAILCVCELEDGSFVSGSADQTLKNWDGTGKRLHTFIGHSKGVNRVIELKRDVIVSASNDSTVKIWRVSTGECLKTLTIHSSSVYGLEKVKNGMFVSGSQSPGLMVVWDGNGVCIETHRSEHLIRAMTKLRDGSIVTGDSQMIEIRW